MDHKKQKNLHIIHLATDDGRYYCNQAVKSFSIKMTLDKREVTCLNCKNIIKRLREVEDD